MTNTTLSIETLGSLIASDTASNVKPILREMISQRLTGDAWNEIVAAAKESPLVSWVGHRESDHPAARRMHRVAPSQILDRMNIAALAFTYWRAVEGYEKALRAGFNNPEKCDSEYWPFAKEDTDRAPMSLNVTEDAGKAREALGRKAPSDGQDASEENDAPAEPYKNPYDGISFDDSLLQIVDSLLTRASGGKVNAFARILCELGEAGDRAAKAEAEVKRLRAAPPVVQAAPVAASGDVPAGEPVRVHAGEAFGMKSEALLDFEITAYEWEGENPLVPSLDQHYRFDTDALAAVLFAFEHGINPWLVGHTGTGKTTLIEQIAARLNHMVTRVNFDSDITRMEFVGKVDVAIDENGNQVTTFSDGILPRALEMPTIMLLDEADAIRGDIAYILQPVLEGGNLRLLEDGGRIVQRHPGFRIVATANSAGSGDTSGLYSAGVKLQSAAAMNRYGMFVPVDYMPVEEEIDLALRKTGAVLSDDMRLALQNFVEMYRKAFVNGEVSVPMSPRNTLTMVRYAGFYEGGIGSRQAYEGAVRCVMLNRLDEGDASVVRGIMDRTTNL